MDDDTRLSRCTACGAELSPDAPEGLCPACLLFAAVAPVSQPTGPEQTTVGAAYGERSNHAGDQPLAPGVRFGPYRIERLLGRGGMGDVYEAEHVEQGRHVALKVLSQRFSSASDRARFLREGQLAASLTHPHVCYIYGSEEIAGVPVIAMELLPGGTLRDRVRTGGPLAPAHAVDAILQVIAGLDAAQAAGILHRDIKPANCFTDREGTIKIGDFGLSITTAARDRTELLGGGFQGTPQFAAPEQLRGEALDVRSDIYAVGVTLYYLLTGALPFDDADLGTLIERVKTEPPRSPHAIRGSVPRGLARIVLRCMAKDRGDRVQSYAELEDRLRVFGSAAATPGTLGWRFLANAIDHVVLALPFLPLNIAVTMRRSDLLMLMGAVQLLALVLYYGVQEGLWGATIGKRAMGLRVTDRLGHPVGMARAMGRAVAFLAPSILVGIPSNLLGPVRLMEMSSRWPALGVVMSLIVWIGYALLFSTARRRNGFAGIHELVSGTRVIRQKAARARSAQRVHTVLADAPRGSHDVIGPYVVTAPLGSTDQGQMLLGFDPRLRRPVWIHRLAAGAPPVPPAIRDLSRMGRVRWLSGRRSDREAWDAYEALDGAPFVRVAVDRQPWSVIKRWLHDVAAEIDAAVLDGSLPALAPERVWITAEGRARLLDFTAPGVDAPKHLDRSARVESVQLFLATLTHLALARSSRTADGDWRYPVLPLSAGRFLRALNDHAFRTIPDVVESSRQVLAGRDEVTPARRAASLLLCGVAPALFATTMLLPMLLWQYVMPPDVDQLNQSLRYLASLSPDSEGRAGAEREAVEVYISAQFGPRLSDPAFWKDPFRSGTLGSLRPLAKRVMSDHPAASPDDLARVTPSLGPFLQAQKRADASRQAMMSSMALPVMGLVMGFLLAAGCGLVGATALRSGLLLRALGLAVVTPEGVRASRLRALWRAVLGWAPGGLCAALILYGNLPFRSATSAWQSAPLAFIAVMGAAVLLAAGTGWAIAHPDQGLQDRLAGTRVVPL